MSKLFEELKGKDIRIKTWYEMFAMDNTAIYEDEIQTTILFLDDNGNVFNSFSSTIKYLCGKVIKVDETMIPDDLFKENKDLLKEDRDLLYYDEEHDKCCYFDISMFEVIEAPELKEENLFEELKGKDIKIKTWEEMCRAENSELTYDRYDETGREDIIFRNEDGIAETYFSCEMKHLCGRVIHVDKNMISDGWFRMAEDGLVKDRELVYWDKIFSGYWYLDTNMFDVLEEDTDVDVLEEIEDNFYVIEETTGKRVFCGTREECFKYYKTHVDIFKNQFKRIAVLKEI